MYGIPARRIKRRASLFISCKMSSKLQKLFIVFSVLRTGEAYTDQSLDAVSSPEQHITIFCTNHTIKLTLSTCRAPGYRPRMTQINGCEVSQCHGMTCRVRVSQAAPTQFSPAPELQAQTRTPPPMGGYIPGDLFNIETYNQPSCMFSDGNASIPG